MNDPRRSINIRAAVPADLKTIGRLAALLVQMHHDLDAKRFIPATPDTPSGYGGFLGTQLNKPGIAILVADQGGEIVGYTYSGIEGHDYMALRRPAGVLYDIVVDPAHRGLGIGQELLSATLAELKSRGAPRVLLSTAERNEGAHRFFEHAGFRRTMIEMTREMD